MRDISMDTEPARIIGLLTTLIGTAIPLISMQLGWTANEAELWQNFLVAAVTVVVIYGGFEVTRGRVFSPATHREDVDRALMEQPPE